MIPVVLKIIRKSLRSNDIPYFSIVRSPIARIFGYRNFHDNIIALTAVYRFYIACDPRYIRNAEKLFRTVSCRTAAGYGMFEYVLGDNSIRSYAEIHLMTIKVFTAPRRTPHFEIWQLGSPPVYTVSRRCPLAPFLLSNPLFLSHTTTPLPFSYSFSRFLAGYRLGEGKPRITLIPPRGFPYYLQAPTCALPSLCPLQ